MRGGHQRAGEACGEPRMAFIVWQAEHRSPRAPTRSSMRWSWRKTRDSAASRLVRHASEVGPGWDSIFPDLPCGHNPRHGHNLTCPTRKPADGPGAASHAALHGVSNGECHSVRSREKDGYALHKALFSRNPRLNRGHAHSDLP